MNVSQDLSILHLILNASAVVQAVMLLLAGVSFMSWYYIFRKWFTVKAARAQTEQFERDFWSGGDLNSLYQSAINDRHSTGSMERIFEAGFREFTKLRSQKNLDPKDVIDGSRRAMRATYQREMDSIDSHLAFLASVGSVSPYVGLFGTVWGIMHSFRGLSTSARRRSPRSRRGLPKRWWPRPSASLRRFRRWSPTTASRTRSTASPRASSPSWKSSRTSCNGR
jgi:biopolymer transport protein TolQ